MSCVKPSSAKNSVCKGTRSEPEHTRAITVSKLSEGGHRYELLSNETPDHHHLICIRCGRTEEFENDEVLEAGKVAAKVNGFKLIESSLNVRAICPNCI